MTQVVHQIPLILGDAGAQGQTQFQANLAVFLDEVTDGVFIEHPHTKGRSGTSCHTALATHKEVGFAQQAAWPQGDNRHAATFVGQLCVTLFDKVEGVTLRPRSKDQLTRLISLKTHPLSHGPSLSIGELSEQGCVLDELFLHDRRYLPQRVGGLAKR